jgi:hypothetical protein
MIGSAPGVGHTLVRQIRLQILRHIARAIVRQQAWTTPNLSLIQAGNLGAGIVKVRGDTLATAQLGDGLLTTEAFKNDADLLFLRKLATSFALDLADDFFGVSSLSHCTLLLSLQISRSVLRF